ncbi:MAG: SpoIID/LytB domain-containing protein [Candidatus Electryoneaceae bacterium]|nr:SpoIID/LytB domain-containing protein [Candidatus Electryoneaceae bacterium]
MGRTRTSVSEVEMVASSRRGDRVRRRELSGFNPIVRIGLMEEYDRIDFSVQGVFDIVSLSGDTIAEGVVNDQRWHVVPDTTTEARAVYSILTTAFAKRDGAERLRKKLNQRKHQARIVEVGTEVMIDGRMVTDNIKYRVLVGRWSNEREVKRYIDVFQDEFAPRIVRQITHSSSGTIDLFNEDFSLNQKIQDGFRIIPHDEHNPVTLYDVREGTGFHWEREVDRDYPGIFEVRVDHRGLLMALTELPLETYLKGVVPSEMPASYPFEALKGQTIAARSETLAKIGIKHLNDPFDLCAHVHCQAYSGCSRQNELTDRAVDETCGQVLMMNERVVDAVYSACCGGHLEDKVNVWNPPAASHLMGHWDAPDDVDLDTLDLTQELDVIKWVNSSPQVWCNTRIREGLPDMLARAERSFRWEVVYTRSELEDIIRRKSGEEIGDLVDIITLERGESGRMMEIEIQGTRKNLRVQRELNIRGMLSLKYLRSACFSIEIDTSEDGRPVMFRFRGAGWGHGVGMCQVGAGVMAFEGKTYQEILNHYYPGTNIEKVYGE